MKFTIKSFMLLLITICWCSITLANEKVAQDKAPAKVASKQIKKSDDKKATQEFTCSGKRTCSQMTSCAEARFYLVTCRVSSLDRDKDGIPCESIC